jgi:hypothetical protein
MNWICVEDEDLLSASCECLSQWGGIPATVGDYERWHLSPSGAIPGWDASSLAN